MDSVQLANSCYLTYHAIVEQINIYFKFFNCLEKWKSVNHDSDVGLI